MSQSFLVALVSLGLMESFLALYQLVEKLSAKSPDGPTKVKILTSIAEEHNIKWDPNSFGGNDSHNHEDLLVILNYVCFSSFASEFWLCTSSVC